MSAHSKAPYITPSMELSSGKGVVRGHRVQQLTFTLYIGLVGGQDGLKFVHDNPETAEVNMMLLSAWNEYVTPQNNVVSPSTRGGEQGCHDIRSRRSPDHAAFCLCITPQSNVHAVLVTAGYSAIFSNGALCCWPWQVRRRALCGARAGQIRRRRKARGDQARHRWFRRVAAVRPGDSAPRVVACVVCTFDDGRRNEESIEPRAANSAGAWARGPHVCRVCGSKPL